MMGDRLVGAAVLVVVTAATAAAAPAQPALAGGARTFVAFAGSPAPVRLAWSPAANVARYRARWTDGAALVDVELPGTATAFERSVATPGRHRLSVVAIDADGRESPPADVAVDIVTITAVAPGDDQSVAQSTTTPSAFAVGTRFASPGLACRLGDGSPGREALARVTGAMQLACGGEAGQPRVEVGVVIAPVVIAGPTRPLVRGRERRVHVTVASVAPLGDKLDLEAIGELDLGDAERTEHGFDVAITARGPGSLVVRSAALELGRVELDVVEPAPPRTRGGELAWFGLDVGAQIGTFIPPAFGGGALALGHPNQPEDALTTAPLAGGRLGLFPTRRVGVEAEAALATPRYQGHPGVAAVVMARVQLAARVVESHRYGLRALAGADLLGLASETGSSHRDALGGLHVGAAVTLEARPNLQLRLQALDVIAPSRDAGYAHCPELQIGVVTRLGREDRW